MSETLYMRISSQNIACSQRQTHICREREREKASAKSFKHVDAVTFRDFVSQRYSREEVEVVGVDTNPAV